MLFQNNEVIEAVRIQEFLRTTRDGSSQDIGILQNKEGWKQLGYRNTLEQGGVEAVRIQEFLRTTKDGSSQDIGIPQTNEGWKQLGYRNSLEQRQMISDRLQTQTITRSTFHVLYNTHRSCYDYIRLTEQEKDYKNKTGND